jgi:hypothetical protein
MVSTRMRFKLLEVAPSTTHSKDNNNGIHCQSSTTCSHEWKPMIIDYKLLFHHKKRK